MNDQNHAAVIATLFKNTPPETGEEIDDALRAFGYDPDEVGRRGETTARLALEGVRLRALVEELAGVIAQAYTHLGTKGYAYEGVEEWAIMDILAAAMRGTQGEPVAQLCDPFSDVERANAHLVAAAPDLLEACEIIYDELEERGWARCPAEEAIISVLEKAIAKARGETQ
jgi:hypothetical protein